MPSGSNFMSEANKVESGDARLVRPRGLPTSNTLVGCLFNPLCGLFFLGRCAYTGVTFGHCPHVTPAYYQSLTPAGVYFLLSPFSTLLYLLYICKIFADIQQIYDYY